MGRRLRRIVLISSAATTIALFSNTIWAKKPVHVEPAVKATSASKCPMDLNAELAKRISNPHKVTELLNMISEATLTYRRAAVALSDTVEGYISEQRRFPQKDRKHLKRAAELESEYIGRIKNAINAYSIPREESKKEILKMMKGCRYIYTESASRAVASQFEKDDALPKEAREDPTLWHVVKPEVTPLPKAAVEELKKKSEIS